MLSRAEIRDEKLKQAVDLRAEHSRLVAGSLTVSNSDPTSNLISSAYFSISAHHFSFAMFCKFFKVYEVFCESDVWPYNFSRP